jgi:sugar phosphate isomerase/epimerase
MYEENIRIGTLVNGGENTVNYLKQIMPHGFESISITFWQNVDVDIVKFAAETRAIVEGAGAVISSVSCFGNPLERREIDDVTRKGWETLIDNTHLFGCNIVTGFAGRLIDVPIDQQMDRYAEVWGPLAKRAADKGVKIAFENCDMGGTWSKGDWNIAMTPVAWEMMFNAIPSENVGLQWEPCHQMVKLIDPIPQLRKYVSKVFALHGKDCTINWDVIRETGIIGPNQFAFHRTPGFGDSNWTDIITILRMGGFKGSIDIEGWHDPVYRGELEMMGQVHGLNYLKACRGGAFVPNPE